MLVLIRCACHPEGIVRFALYVLGWTSGSLEGIWDMARSGKDRSSGAAMSKVRKRLTVHERMSNIVQSLSVWHPEAMAKATLNAVCWTNGCFEEIQHLASIARRISSWTAR